MNASHFHLLVNHFPIVLPIVGFLILIAGLILKSDILKRAAYLVFILGGITALMAVQSGEGSEEIVEKLPGADHHLIHEHEEAAEAFAVLSYILAFMAMIALWTNWKKKSVANILTFIVLAISIAAIYFSINAGASGGEILHKEIKEK